MELDKRLTHAPDLITDRDKLYHILEIFWAMLLSLPGRTEPSPSDVKSWTKIYCSFLCVTAGIGIEESKLQYIFNSFRQADE